jgi:hypothetical protein
MSITGIPTSTLNPYASGIQPTPIGRRPPTTEPPVYKDAAVPPISVHGGPVTEPPVYKDPTNPPISVHGGPVQEPPVSQDPTAPKLFSFHGGPVKEQSTVQQAYTGLQQELQPFALGSAFSSDASALLTPSALSLQA